MSKICHISFVISRGWQDYTIDHLDKCDSFEDTHTIEFAEATGETFGEAFKKATEDIWKTLNEVLEDINCGVAEGRQDAKGGAADATTFCLAVAEFSKGDWEIVNDYLLRKDLGEAGGKKLRWEVTLLNEEDYGLPLEGGELLEVVSPTLTVAA